ncbi:MAG TPA: hypothetical protein EYN79_06350 [Planctomycetes bacterium]|nr:hypothetical protein [Planctomycetota bacterium]HIN79943.1 hypothetical protein [Planctomycetota bacterium]
MSEQNLDRALLRETADDLCAVISRLGQFHHQLLELQEEKEAALTDFNFDSIGSIRERETGLLRCITAEEEARFSLSFEIGEMIGHENPAALVIDEFVEYLDEDQVGALVDLRDHLQEMAVKLVEQNEKNETLVRHTLGHIDVFMSHLTASEYDAEAYDAKGDKSGGGSGSFLIDRAG